ncbi:hypothetical protein TVAG_157520 [Trichomonas vaginalis G3]|uniref:Uncharacterized protein n=1 Tax=Trichomonas vaginalis (strain ATCC PRA-98 / G3) TaxID=412133 RepID=A2E9M4_TRIV3|nr:armadillo (ARM) repeat-containing protein family [Trichomonas vaginalis G3]EAY10675.1 hypothetical protein TVAG_157520 [Trichomonas vaginalis G3]KAI5512183.1 armadillo (ARM) repeat-containing protein family [Trichomonas vaginalis G3]|eukprot:XP_001322898.1 hypothetical protein [Trichomonas vaginalis G3]
MCDEEYKDGSELQKKNLADGGPDEYKESEMELTEIPHASYDQCHKYMKNMAKCESPIGDIIIDFGTEVIPIFNTKFNHAVVTFLLENPNECLDLLDYILNGPIKNIMELPYDVLLENFIQNLPLSLEFLARYMKIASRNPRISLYFIDQGGVSALYRCLSEKENYIFIAQIFYAISNVDLSFHTVYKEEKIDLGYSDPNEIDLDNSDVDELPDQISEEKKFRDISDSLMRSSNEEVRMLLLQTYNNICDKSPQHHSFIANHIISVYHLFKTNPFRKAALEVLSKSLSNLKDAPKFSLIWDQVPALLRSDDKELVAALCSFVSKIVDKYSSDYICDSEIFHEFVEFAQEKCSFIIKKSIVSCLASIIKKCNHENLQTLITQPVVQLFRDFIDDTTNENLDNILVALLRIGQEAEMEGPLDDIIAMQDDIADLTMNDNDLVVDAATELLEFIDFVQNQQ